MGASQIWQQKLAPAAGMDPIQQKMMLLMPVFFTFLFLWYPVGRGALLVRQQHLGDRSAVPDELHDRSAAECSAGQGDRRASGG